MVPPPPGSLDRPLLPLRGETKVMTKVASFGTNMTHRHLLAAGVVAALLAVGCETPTSPSPVPAPRPTTPVVSVPQPEPEPLDEAFVMRPELARKMARLANEDREVGQMCGDEWFPPVRALRWDDRLTVAAERHALDTLQADRVGHTGTDGSTVRSRARDAGFPATGGIGEIGMGGTLVEHEQPERGMWESSAAHCRILMLSNLRYIGSGHVSVENPDPERVFIYRRILVLAE